MGLDYVELVMEVEEAFSIQISDRAAEQVRTPAELAALVCDLVGVRRPPGCESRRAFFRLRDAVARRTRLERRSIRPGTPVLDCIRTGDHRRRWLRALSDLRLHPRRRRTREPEAGVFGPLPHGQGTFGDIARALVERDRSLYRADGRLSYDAVLQRVREITAEQMGLSLEEVRPDSDFIRDIG